MWHRALIFDFGAERARSEVLLAARLLLVALYLLSGWQKLTNFPGAVDYMSQVGAPMPPVSAAIAVFVELVLAISVGLGLLTRPLALLFAVYTLATALIGHRYWVMTGAVRADNMVHFFKNISIAGGFLLLYVAGPGPYALDKILRGADRSESYDASGAGASKHS